MLTNSDLTLFNRYYDNKKDCYLYKKTYLKGVNWQDTKSISVTDLGAVSVDRTTIFVPVDVNSGGNKYLKPKTFKRHADKTLIYTFENEDIVVKGIIDFDINTPKGVANLQHQYDDVMVITKVVDNRYGSKGIQHFELEVK